MSFQRFDFVKRTTKDFNFMGWVLGTVETIKGKHMVIVQNGELLFMCEETLLEQIINPPGPTFTLTKGGDH